MNIEIKNFGPIDYLNIDLDKDLHLIYGKNAIGKSYAIYCVYSLLKNIRDRHLNTENRYFFLSERSDIFEILIKELNINGSPSKQKEKSKDLSKTIFEIIEKEIKIGFLKQFKNSLQNTFTSIDNLRNRFTNDNFQITLNLSNSTTCKKLQIFSNNNDELDVKVELADCKFELIKKNTKTTRFSFNQNGKKVFGEPSEKEFISNLTFYIFNRINKIYEELDSGIRDIYFLPASRSGLYQALNSFAPMLAEFSQKRFFLGNKNIELPALSEPLSDYFIDLSTLNKRNINKEFIHLVKIIEEKILNGEVDYDEDTKKIIYKPRNLNLALNISEASSMVSELTPLALFLKHILNHKFNPDPQLPLFFRPKPKEKGADVLFIEEPEAHLHPEIQVELMKVFAELTTHRLKIFITSHSNYMFNELNNLILENKIDRNKIAIYHLIQGKNGTIQNPEMTVTEDGIYDENFQETSEKLYEERMRILEEAA